MIVELYFEIATDEFSKTLSLCVDSGAEVLMATQNTSPNGHHEFKIRMACDTYEDYHRLSQIMLYYLDDPAPTFTATAGGQDGILHPGH